jgi:glycosyltransferase involved in cell wall biosynthesis
MAGRDFRKEHLGLARLFWICPVGCQTDETKGIKRIIKFNFPPEKWHSAASVDRPFVLYPHPESSPGSFWHYRPGHRQTGLSVVIPTSDAWRGGYFIKLLSQIKQQDLLDFELIVIKGDPRQGRAINIGATLSEGKYIITLDDDTSLPDPGTFNKLKKIMKAHPEIGIAGGNNVIPENAVPLIRRAMQEIPRRSWEPVLAITDSDLAEHPCMIMRKADFIAAGGENELIPRGLDPYLREQFRKLGKRIVVVPDVIYHHLPPDRLYKLLRQFYRNGVQAAYANRNYPQWVIETPAGHGTFKTRIPLPLRALRFPIRLLQALITGKFIWFLSESAYALGFVLDSLGYTSKIMNDRKQNPIEGN